MGWWSCELPFFTTRCWFNPATVRGCGEHIVPPPNVEITLNPEPAPGPPSVSPSAVVKCATVGDADAPDDVTSVRVLLLLATIVVGMVVGCGAITILPADDKRGVVVVRPGALTICIPAGAIWVVPTVVVSRCGVPINWADVRDEGGLIRFSFCLRLQNHTRTTSFSICRLSPSMQISSDVGFEFCRKLFSRATRTEVSILVRFFRRRPMASAALAEPLRADGFDVIESASSNHLWRSGFSLHMFLKLRFSASKREMVVWLKSLP